MKHNLHAMFIIFNYIVPVLNTYSEDEHITSLAEFKVQKISPRQPVSHFCIISFSG